MTNYDEILGFKASKYQNEIFNFIEHGNGNAVISALAGAGKTTSLVTAMKLVQKNKSCLFLAFNNRIVDDLNKKIKDFHNCKAMTIHKLGLMICYRNLGDVEVDEYKYRTFLKNNIEELTSDNDFLNKSKKDVNLYIENISELIHFSRVNLAQSEKEIKNIANKYGIIPVLDEIKVTKKCLKWGKENTNTIDYTDMVWLPTELSLSTKGFQYDWIFGDEAQDFTLAYIELIKKCHKRGTRTVFVGDKKQTINSFAGSSEEAFDILCESRNTKVFSLPITYRCPKKVVELARQFTPNLEWAENAKDGVIVNEAHIYDLKANDLVISRSRAPLFQLYNKLLKRNVKAYIEGSKDESKHMLDLVNSCDSEILNSNLNDVGLFTQLYERLFKVRNKVMKDFGLDIDDATVSNNVIQMYDTINSLITLSKGLTFKKQLIERIKKVFEKDDDGVRLSTIHKAKGGEANNVYILCFSSMPSSLAKKDWEKIQEENLIYVALTRAKEKLGFISENEIKPNGCLLSREIIIDEINTIENIVCKLNGTTPKTVSDEPKMAKFKLKSSSDMNKQNGLKNNISLNNTKQKKSLNNLFR